MLLPWYQELFSDEERETAERRLVEHGFDVQRFIVRPDERVWRRRAAEVAQRTEQRASSPAVAVRIASASALVHVKPAVVSIVMVGGASHTLDVEVDGGPPLLLSALLGSHVSDHLRRRQCHQAPDVLPGPGDRSRCCAPTGGHAVRLALDAAGRWPGRATPRRRLKRPAAVQAQSR